MSPVVEVVDRYARPVEEDGPGQWLTAAAAGDQGAWDLLVNRYNAMVWSIARAHRLAHHDSADVVQTTWLRLVEHVDRVREPDRVGAWLATTARNECLAHLRRHGRQIPADIDEIVDSGPGLDEALLGAERQTALWRALQHVSDRCRQLLRILASDPAPSYDEVGAAMQMPIGSIGPTRARCLETLRRLMAADSQADGLSGAS